MVRPVLWMKAMKNFLLLLFLAYVVDKPFKSQKAPIAANAAPICQSQQSVWTYS